jgi:hypothetical protein
MNGEQIPDSVITPEDPLNGGGHMATVAGWRIAKECPKCKSTTEEVLHLMLKPETQWPNQVIVHRECGNVRWFFGQIPLVGVNWRQ